MTFDEKNLYLECYLAFNFHLWKHNITILLNYVKFKIFVSYFNGISLR
jgi:hypothetical protein